MTIGSGLSQQSAIKGNNLRMDAMTIALSDIDLETFSHKRMGNYKNSLVNATFIIDNR